MRIESFVSYLARLPFCLFPSVCLTLISSLLPLLGQPFKRSSTGLHRLNPIQHITGNERSNAVSPTCYPCEHIAPMGNTTSASTPTFLLQAEQHHAQDDFTTNPMSSASTSKSYTRHKTSNTKPDLKEPAFEGYVAGWRQTDSDSDAQEFSFATFQQDNHHNHSASSGYEGDDEGPEAVERNMRVRREEFEDLDRGRGLGRSGSYRERQMEKRLEGGDGDGAAVRGGRDVRTWRERKWEEPSLGSKLDRVRRTAADEHASPKGCGRDAVGVKF